MRVLMVVLMFIMLPVLLSAEFEPLQTIIDLAGEDCFYFDRDGGCSLSGAYVSYAIVRINLTDETSCLELYRSDDGGASFSSSELVSWASLPEILDMNWYQKPENYYQEPVVLTSESGSLKIFYEDVESGALMMASAAEYWGVFDIEASPFTDMYNDPFLWQDGEEIWSLGLMPSSIPVCCFQSYMGRMISVNASEENWDALKYWGPDVFGGEVFTNSDIWIQQAGGGSNNGWPMFQALVMSGGTIMDFATGAPAVNSAPMDEIFWGGYIEDYVEEMGEIELPGLALEVRENGLILDSSADRDIFFVKIDGISATCRYADIEYEEMEFTVYNSYPDPLHPEWAIGDSIWTNVVQVPHIDWDDATFNVTLMDASAFCYCELWIEGSVSGNVTWASADTVYITDDITYESVASGEEVPFDCPDMFGLISEKSILIKYKHWDPDTGEIESPNCDGITLYGAYAALGVADPNSAYPGYEEGIFSFEYQHPHGSTPDFTGVSPFTGNDTLFSYIDFHKYVMPPAEGYTGDAGFILHSNYPAVGYSACGYPYENPDYWQADVTPYGTEKPFYNPVWPESSEDIVYERGEITVFGSIAQRRGGFSHRSGTDPCNHDDYIINHSEHLYGGTHESVGYGKAYHNDDRLGYEIYPVDFVEVDNYFKQYRSNSKRSDFDLSEVEEMGDMEMKAWEYVQLLTADNEGEEYVAIMYQEPFIVEIVYSEDGEINKEMVGLEESGYEVREVYLEGNSIFIETREILYRHELGNSDPAEVVLEILEPEDWHGVEWNAAGDGLLLKIGEGDNTINIERYNEESGEFEELVNYALPSAEILNEIYDDLEFAYRCQGNGEILANYLQRKDAEEYYQKLYQMRGEISMLPADEDDIVPLASDLSIYPNPFNPELTVHYNIEKTQEVQIAIYNLRGEKVITLVDEVLTAGAGQKVWNGRNAQDLPCGSGVYFVQMRAGEQQFMQKAVLLK
ncbi:MAG: T9SS type A sorting domain-containing protein [Candidatus Cloacimonetes bacterium]|nr:T9SS type A sorting domain-containing protein [Candidatus Cloacimonadota bacterium]